MFEIYREISLDSHVISWILTTQLNESAAVKGQYSEASERQYSVVVLYVFQEGVLCGISPPSEAATRLSVCSQ